MENKQKIKVRINGFGKIGCLVTGVVFESNDIEIVAMNNQFMTPEDVKTRFDNDNYHGKLTNKVGQSPDILAYKNPGRSHGVIIEPSMLLKVLEPLPIEINLLPTLTEVLRKLLFLHQARMPPMFVVGVNEKNYKSDINIVSNANPAINCLAPLTKVLYEKFRIVEDLVTNLHSASTNEKTIDSPLMRGGRTSSFIPSSTEAAKAVRKVLPSLDGKLTGTDFHVLILYVSGAHLTAKLVKSATYNEYKAVFKTESEGSLNEIPDYTEDDVV